MGSRRKTEYNIVILGALGVGKSALTVKYMTKRFIMEYDPFIEDIYTKHEGVESQDFFVNVMDTFEKDDSNSQRYFRWADAYMIVYSITDRTSFETAKDYTCKVSDYLKNANKECPIALVGNKSDLERYRQVSKSDGQTLCTDHCGLFFECTAAEDYECVEDVFHGLVHAIQKSRGDRSLVYSPLFISEDRVHAGQKARPRSPKNSTDKKDDIKQANKKNPSSFKLFNKSFKIFN
ncbi:ras-like protein family member 12 [Dreissena polymorpha]|uniref:small monomeric GTPase n=1 Tax=Dreissena polymorpha TaxID=45954 RepID=A0A9D4LJL5_DREPO|nr:ras-like protein family member 12 [Dreissena polymorpha]XP_052270545.1 ras-like protein family member 12 [Dreissena polymorpha]KAH3857927.1 hypothetical protein DPMN_100545 [Dreissena polymorpha]KAH3858011.1 hypothetical protein DPMN_100630 [Dreissena polymorpha]